MWASRAGIFLQGKISLIIQGWEGQLLPERELQWSLEVQPLEACIPVPRVPVFPCRYSLPLETWWLRDLTFGRNSAMCRIRFYFRFRFRCFWNHRLLEGIHGSMVPRSDSPPPFPRGSFRIVTFPGLLIVPWIKNLNPECVIFFSLIFPLEAEGAISFHCRRVHYPNVIDYHTALSVERLSLISTSFEAATLDNSGSCYYMSRAAIVRLYNGNPLPHLHHRFKQFDTMCFAVISFMFLWLGTSFAGPLGSEGLQFASNLDIFNHYLF